MLILINITRVFSNLMQITKKNKIRQKHFCGAAGGAGNGGFASYSVGPLYDFFSHMTLQSGEAGGQTKGAWYYNDVEETCYRPNPSQSNFCRTMGIDFYEFLAVLTLLNKNA